MPSQNANSNSNSNNHTNNGNGNDTVVTPVVTPIVNNTIVTSQPLPFTQINFEDFSQFGLVPTSYVQGSVVNSKSIITSQFMDRGILLQNAALVELGNGHASSGKEAIAGTKNGKLDYDAAIQFAFTTKVYNTGPVKGNGNSIGHTNDQSNNHANSNANDPINDHTVGSSVSVRGTVSYFAYTPDKNGASGNTITISGFDVNGNLLGKVSVVEKTHNMGPIVLTGVGEMYSVTVDNGLRIKSWGGIALDDVTFDSVDPVVTTVGSTVNPLDFGPFQI